MDFHRTLLLYFWGCVLLHCNAFKIAKRTGATEYIPHPDNDCAGNSDWGGYTRTLRECQQLCDQNPQCVAFTFKVLCSYNEHNCWPKARCDEFSANSQGLHSYTKSSGAELGDTNAGSNSKNDIKSVQCFSCKSTRPTRAAEYPVTTESDCAGNDHWGGYTYSLAECQQFCDQQPDCVAFVHKDMCWYSEHSCWPKISCDDVTTNSEGWNVYKKQKIPDQPGGCGLHAKFEAYPGYALYEYDDETLTDITEPECARRCMMMGDRCLSFDYNNCTKACALSSESKDTVARLARHRPTTYYHKVCIGSDGDSGNPGGDDDEDDDDEVSAGSADGTDDHDVGEDIYPGVSHPDIVSGDGTDDTDDEDNTKRDCKFTAYPGYALFGHNDQIYREVSLEECTEFCELDELCMSFDYSQTTGSCFNSYYSRLTAPLDFGTHSTLTYYELECNVTQPTDGGDDGDVVEEGSSDGLEMSGSGAFDRDSDDEDTTSTSPCLSKLGPYGGKNGNPFSDRKKFLKHQGAISKIHVRHATYIDCLGFTYGRGDQAVEGHCRGGDGGEEEVIDLEVGEIITGIKARTGSLFDQLTFVTNLRELGPYGGSGGNVLVAETGGKQLAYISGRSGSLLDQLTLHFYC